VNLIVSNQNNTQGISAWKEVVVTTTEAFKSGGD